MWVNNINYNLVGCVVVTLLAIFIESLIIPRVLLIAKKKRLFDTPDFRKIHSNPIPRLAGVTFAPVIVLSVLPVLCILTLLFPNQVSYFNPAFILSASCFFCGLIVLMLTGVKDDLIGVRYSHKFILQLIAAIFLVCSGNYINHFYGILGIHEVSPFLGIPFTLLLTVSIINAINLIDGVDGLAAILISIAAAVFGVGFFVTGSYTYAFLSFSVVGVLIPFLRFNFSTNRKIFMGDTGSLVLGFVLSFLAVRCCMLTPGKSPDNPLPVIIAASVLFVPLFDTIRVFGVRFMQHKPIFYPDKNHIHHKLLGLGCSHKQVCLVLGLITLFHLGMNICLHQVVNVNILLVINVILGIIENIFLNFRHGLRGLHGLRNTD
ncbi:MraY family glycosyltransferase [Bacteroides sp. 519]|uniref:MraY family glycosyltransferase n=1 Tax=Bacteroides sp. 519 TaxID=2302937 RepID=UPI0013D81A37|nr:MraY family glycosyltransferase [Bacteroides sp. 519]NDV57780.1 undecaprenyl/decaprenyl-phosphate alpha-N-acetylglucosaminyl 1-phosphate transferase [Bacteroides sp. 519]